MGETKEEVVVAKVVEDEVEKKATSSLPHKQEEEDECPICIEALQKDTNKFVRMTCCGKGMHIWCYKGLNECSSLNEEQKIVVLCVVQNKFVHGLRKVKHGHNILRQILTTESNYTAKKQYSYMNWLQDKVMPELSLDMVPFTAMHCGLVLHKVMRKQKHILKQQRYKDLLLHSVILVLNM